MRAPGILLLLLAVLATVAYPRMETRSVVAAKRPSAVANPQATAVHYWRYSEDAPFHEYLDPEAQQFASTDPQEAANRICTELGGVVGHVASVDDHSMSVAFLCRFSEPDVTMSVDFGELDRISVP